MNIYHNRIYLGDDANNVHYDVSPKYQGAAGARGVKARRGVPLGHPENQTPRASAYGAHIWSHKLKAPWGKLHATAP